jgi:hypothetical protein
MHSESICYIYYATGYTIEWPSEAEPPYGQKQQDGVKDPAIAPSIFHTTLPNNANIVSICQQPTYQERFPNDVLCPVKPLYLAPFN